MGFHNKVAIRQGLGVEVQQAECRLLSVLARSAPQASGEMRSHRRPPNIAPHRLISFRTFLLETELLAFTVYNRWTQPFYTWLSVRGGCEVS